MALPVTLSDLRQRFYDRFDEGSSQYIDIPQANRLINEGAAHLHNRIVASGEDYLWRRKQYQTINNVQDYDLPPDFFKDRKVFGTYSLPSGGTTSPYYWPIERIMVEEFRGGPQTVFRFPFDQPFGYMILGNTLRLTPIPVNANFNIEMWYVPTYTALVNDSDALDLSVAPGWEEFVINQATIGAYLKSQDDTTQLERRQAAIWAIIEESLINRDLGRPQRVVDVTGNAMYDGFGWPGGGMF